MSTGLESVGLSSVGLSPDAAAASGTHDTTGALSADASSVAGSATHLTLHTTTGALSAQAATVSGTATHPHTTTGALAAQDAIIVGSAAHTAPGIHSTTGALSSDAATISGTAAHLTLHTTTGALSAQNAIILGAATGPGTQTAGGDDVPYTRKQLRKIAAAARKAEEERRKRWQQAQEDDAELSAEILGVYNKLRGIEPEQVPAEVVAAPEEKVREIVQAMPVMEDDSAQVAERMLQLIEQARQLHARHLRRLHEEDELMVMLAYM